MYFGLFCSFNPKLPRIPVRLHHNAIRKGLFIATVCKTGMEYKSKVCVPHGAPYKSAEFG